MIFNPFKPHVVQFNNGKYGVRRWRFGWEYRSSTNSYWWAKDSEYFQCCMLNTLDDVYKHPIMATEKAIKCNLC